MGCFYSKCCCYRKNKWTGENNELEPMPGTVFTWLPHEGNQSYNTATESCMTSCMFACLNKKEMFTVTPETIVEKRIEWDGTAYYAALDEENRGRHSMKESDFKLSVGEDETIDVLVTQNTKVEGKQAAFIVAHGGGGVFGSAKEEKPFYDRCAIDYGCTVFNVDYRLAPEHKIPTGTKDFLVAVKYIIEHAEEYNIDTDRIVIGGQSGGAMIVCAAAYELALNDEAHLIKNMWL